MIPRFKVYERVKLTFDDGSSINAEVAWVNRSGSLRIAYDSMGVADVYIWREETKKWNTDNNGYQNVTIERI